MPDITSGTHRAIKPDAQAFDEIRIRTVPRYKTSGLSGDEWRISAVIEFYRNGCKIHESKSLRNVETAVYFLPAEWHRACDDGHGFFAGEGDFCDQEGCSERATVTYRVKKEFSHNNPHEWNKPLDDNVMIRKFCQRHSTRGDCAFDDADANYELIAGEAEAPPRGDVKRSVLGGIINMPATPRCGTCCSCGYEGEEQSVCLRREDGCHCEHWWDGGRSDSRISSTHKVDSDR